MTPDEFAALQAMQDQLAVQSAQVAAQIAAAKTAAKAGAIAEVKSLMTKHGLVSADVSGNLTAVKSGAGTGKKTGPVAVKFSHPLSGEKWTGRGVKPRWLTAELASGHSIDEFKIAA